jgi:hypothetical protein
LHFIESVSPIKKKQVKNKVSSMVMGIVLSTSCAAAMTKHWSAGMKTKMIRMLSILWILYLSFGSLIHR